MMRVGPHFVLMGALFGSLIVAGFGLFVSANAATLPPMADAAPASAANLSGPPPSPTADPGSQPAVPVTGLPAAHSAAKPAASAPAQAANGSCDVSSDFPASILQWCDLITQYANQRQLPPNLVAAVMLQESGGQAAAYSRSGAVGLLQVMPRDGLAARFMCKNGPCFTDRPSIAELEDPAFNLEYGTGMLANLTSRHGNYRDALFAYGPMDVGYSYADKVLSIYERYNN